MKNIKYVIPMMIIPTLLASCNSSSHIKRNVFNECTYEKACEVHDAMKKAQISGTYPNEQTTLFNNGSVYFRYSLSAKGTMRLDDLSFHDINLSLSAGYKISWALDKEFVKVEGEKETCYFVKDGDKYWQCHNNTVNGKVNKVKNEVTDDVTDAGGFKNYVVSTINYYCTLEIPLVFTITAGINGESSTPYEITNFIEYPDRLYTKEAHDYLKELQEKYKKGNDYSFDLLYGTNDANTTCVTLKGKLNANDFHETKFRQGTINIDSFVSFKNNFVNQFEIIMDATTLNLRSRYNTNIDSHLYMSQETNKDDCKVEEVKVSEYDEDKEE